LRTADFDYYLPPECIAQVPIEPRHASRLMVLDRTQPDLQHSTFWEIGSFLRPGDLLVINETRVIPARLYAHKLPGGGRVELLLLKRKDEHTWEVLGGGKGLHTGRRLQIVNGPLAEVVSQLEGARRLVRFAEPVEGYLPGAGNVPLPPYIHTPLADPERYQTVYSQAPGSAAAPTAGLHFTPQLMDHLQQQGVNFSRITLHVGLDTFAPVTEADPTQHVIHTEWCELSPASANQINQAYRLGGRIIAVGTTSVRTLESAAELKQGNDRVGAFCGPTNLFILPGYHFQATDAMITNFHLPRSTLLMLVSAFAGRERILETYQSAVQAGYRFYSFGDAMLVT
jgi:S-adenosylmethionine:tRNA ribosyltransferase-isomerase